MSDKTFKSVKQPLTDERRERMSDGRRWANANRKELAERARERREELQTLQRVVAALKQARTDRGLSLSDVAARSGIDRSQLSRLENDPHPNPTLSTLNRLAHAIGVELLIDVRPSAA